MRIITFRHIAPFLLFATLISACMHQKQVVTSAAADQRWAAIDSLAGLGQYASALTLTDDVLADARAASDWRTEYAAWARRSWYQQLTGVEADSIIAPMHQRAQEASTPLAQLLRTTLMDSWWQRYQRDRWRIIERTELDGSYDSDDPETWTQSRYMERVIAMARASLEPFDTLRAIPVADLHELQAGDTGTWMLRPALYDVLAHRALRIFTNTETRLTEPAWRFTLNDARDFELFEPFFFRTLTHRDSTSWEFQALRIYQRLERAHINDDKLDAYVDVAMERLAYVRDRSLLPDKDSLYLAALELLRSRVPLDACEAEVMVAMARWHVEQAGKYERHTSDEWKWERRTAAELCTAAMAKWPGSFGARNAAALLSSLKLPNVSITTERAVPPGKEFLALVKYRNITRLHFRAVADPERNDDSRYEPDRISWLLRQKPVHEWTVELPDDGDLNEHAVEVAAPGLPFGRYAVLVSNGPDFTSPTDARAWCEVTVTNLAVTRRHHGTELDLLVLDRTSGRPKEGVKAIAYVRNREYTGIERFIGQSEFVTGADGMVRTNLKGQKGEVRWRLQDGDDRINDDLMWVYTREQDRTDTLRTFLFTDRAIYRPGQEIHFKGIVTTKRGRGAHVLPGYRTQVRFRDANGEEVDSLVVTTDRFGAFHGDFRIPQGRLTGQWQLQCGNGSRFIQVEEYKRPTFEVAFDPIATAPKLGEEAVLTGVATSYAGAPLDGATVKYVVSRNPIQPWWCGWRWSGLPWWNSTEIASGDARCDAQGRFTVKFMAEADKAFPRDADPSFGYELKAFVTDISGETQEASTSLVVGYRSIDLEVGLGDALDRSKADSAVFRVNNLDGQELDRPFSLRITRLIRPPGGMKRARLWERPDRFVMIEQDFARRFPNDAYAYESDPANWSVGAAVLVHDSIHARHGRIALKGIDGWDVGTYRVEMEAVDPSGRVVKASKQFTLYDPGVLYTGFENEPFHVEAVKAECEPGEKAVLLLSSALPECRVLMEVERDGRIAITRPFTLKAGQQRVELPVSEADRGGFSVHFICVENGRDHALTQRIEVPWSDKQLRVEWMSFRDNMLPGAKEEWRLRITGPKKEHVAAQVLATMYDASLDRFVMPSWWMQVWQTAYPERSWGRAAPFGSAMSRAMLYTHYGVGDSTRRYPRLVAEDLQGGMGRYTSYGFADADQMHDALPGVVMRAEAGNVAAVPFSVTVADSNRTEMEEVQGKEDPASGTSGPAPLRTDFRETAFFFPDLLTDRNGDVVLRFTMPDALTRWNLMGLAHTVDMKSVRFDKSTVTQKPLMVVPNLPRFLRQGDRITLTAKINVIEGDERKGLVRLELYDPTTNQLVSQRFGVEAPERPFSAAPGSSATVAWTLNIPETLDAVAVRITASADGVSDGEERPLPILTDRMLVTESLPISITKSGTKTFELKNLVNRSTAQPRNDPTLRHHSLKLEFTPNPAWYAVQALPYLMEFPHECAEQVFSRYYANHLAAHIVKQRPQVKKVFDAWSKEGAGNEQSFLSAHEKNPELKGIALEETPWLLNARDEGERKRRIALFFDLNRMAAEDRAALGKLQEQQLPNGAWGWWSGMQPSRWITQHIVAGFGHLQQLDALAPDDDARRMIARAVRWLDEETEREHRQRLKGTMPDSLPSPGSEDIHYLYARSCFPQYALDRGKGSAAAFIIERAQRDWLRYGLQEQGMIAIALHRMVDGASAPELIMESLAQRATVSEELGMYWKDFRAGYAWNSLPTETHALMIEAFEVVARDREMVNALKQHLLKLKQTTDWKTTKATADACYVLLLVGDDWLAPKDEPVIRVGATEVKLTGAEAGTGFIEQEWEGAEVKPDMGRVTVTTTSDGVQWGALHWQYFERMDKVPPHESPFSVRRQVMLREQTDAGARLFELDKGRALKPGDRVTVRIELRTDRWVDYVHLKDLRAAGLEPVDALSGYAWKGGLGYYRSIRDAAMHFFFDRIAPGTYVFEYDLKVTHAGDFSQGVTSAMCMYAPEFSSHSEGLRVKVGE